jgi:hypothetical protein
MLPHWLVQPGNATTTSSVAAAAAPNAGRGAITDAATTTAAANSATDLLLIATCLISARSRAIASLTLPVVLTSLLATG